MNFITPRLGALASTSEVVAARTLGRASTCRSPSPKTTKGWSSSWFYVMNHGEAPLPAFTGRFLMDKPPVWEYGLEKEE